MTDLKKEQPDGPEDDLDEDVTIESYIVTYEGGIQCRVWTYETYGEVFQRLNSVLGRTTGPKTMAFPPPERNDQGESEQGCLTQQLTRAEVLRRRSAAGDQAAAEELKKVESDPRAANQLLEVELPVRLIRADRVLDIASDPAVSEEVEEEEADRAAGRGAAPPQATRPAQASAPPTPGGARLPAGFSVT